MRIGEVIGTLTLNKCDPSLCGGRFLIIQPHEPKSLRETIAHQEDAPDAGVTYGRGEVEVAYDGVGAKPGDRVAFSEGREAAMPFHPEKVAIDAYLACILDNVSYDVE